MPSKSTVKRFIEDYRANHSEERSVPQLADNDGAQGADANVVWSSQSSTADEVRLVTRMLAYINGSTRGHRAYFNRSEAQDIVKVWTSRPDLPARKVWILVWEYQVRRRRKVDSHDVDLLLGILPKHPFDEHTDVVRDYFRGQQEMEGWLRDWDNELWSERPEDDLCELNAGLQAEFLAQPHMHNSEEFWRTPQYDAVMADSARKFVRLMAEKATP